MFNYTIDYGIGTLWIKCLYDFIFFYTTGVSSTLLQNCYTIYI